ncbi:MAG: aldo/keto reductase [Betaproteobacteria bacterium]|nr:aldo/keto reductase [Betaproteobacteria bacterium]
MKLGLGTVQFGLDYGITNRTGKPSLGEIRTILAQATSAGIETLDTAASYGDSESMLGMALPRPHQFKIVTKTRVVDATLSTSATLDEIERGVFCSLERLAENKLNGLLIHHVDNLLGPAGDPLFKRLDKLRAQGIVEKIGVSLYSPEEAQAVNARFPLDLIQLPLNPFDQRHVIQGSLQCLVASGIEIHVRSAFLQGLLLAPEQPLPTKLAALAPFMKNWQAFLIQENLSPLAGCFSFLRSQMGISTVICGATSAAEWMEILLAWASNPDIPSERFKKLAVEDVNLIDPRFWPNR